MNRSWGVVSTVTALVVITGCSTTIKNTWSFDQMPRAPVRDTFSVRGLGICAPDDHFVLIRKNEDTAAIKFIDVRVGSEEGTGAARYEAFLFGSRSSFASTGPTRSEGTVSIQGWTGFHPISRQLGNYVVQMKNIKIIYGGTACVMFEPGYEYAPTPWTAISDVDRTADLRWYRYDRLSEILLELKPSEALSPH